MRRVFWLWHCCHLYHKPMLIDRSVPVDVEGLRLLPKRFYGDRAPSIVRQHNQVTSMCPECVLTKSTLFQLVG